MLDRNEYLNRSVPDTFVADVSNEYTATNSMPASIDREQPSTTTDTHCGRALTPSFLMTGIAALEKTHGSGHCDSSVFPATGVKSPLEELSQISK